MPHQRRLPHTFLVAFSVAISIAALASAYACTSRQFNTADKETARTRAVNMVLPSAEVDADLPKVKSWARARVADAEVSFGASGQKRTASPDWWGDEVVYQIQVDRFADGGGVLDFERGYTVPPHGVAVFVPEGQAKSSASGGGL